MKTLTIRAFAAALCLFTCGPKADAEIIQYLVEFAQSGDVLVGSTVDWTLSVLVSDSTALTNFGIQTATVDLHNSTGEDMSPGTVAAPFSDYIVLPSPPMIGTPGAMGSGDLTDLSAALLFYNPAAVEGADDNLGPIVLATGSYQVDTLGMHTLSTRQAVTDSFYYTDALGSTAVYSDVIDGVNDMAAGSIASVNVVAAMVPEPGSMLLASTLLVPGVIGVRRRRQRKAEAAA